MRAINYAAPTMVEDAVRILRENGAGARIFAGGTDLIVQVRENTRDVDVMVDAKGIEELTRVEIGADGSVTLGAAVPCYQIAGDDAIVAAFPGLIDAAGIIGGTAIQGRASLGGNLCNSSPAADGIPALIVHGATANIAGPDGRRSVAVADFCTGPGTNVLAAGEMLVSLTIPALVPNSGAHYLRFTPRNEMDIAVVGAGAQVVLDGDTIVSARIALGAVAPTPMYAAAADEALAGQPATEESYEAAAAAAQNAATPITDMRGTADFRNHLVAVLTKRALRGAVERAKGGAVNGR
ncbi:MAG: xanthine dehydrogenase family protein subunit M [Chloroflexota bacterium]|nr:xanthine dehydrogenase family protein subunit M [Chloroflexota bacterium]MDP6758557.1 xanthine dehydrogenase family protein subunit M [Chloroflexota bacterium]